MPIGLISGLSFSLLLQTQPLLHSASFVFSSMPCPAASFGFSIKFLGIDKVGRDKS